MGRKGRQALTILQAPHLQGLVIGGRDSLPPPGECGIT
jgi:hypothetical protein